MCVDLDSPRKAATIRPVELKRSCRWIGPTAENDLRHGAPAGLHIENLGRIETWVIQPVEGGYDVWLDLGKGQTRLLCQVDTTFGPALSHWDCDCRDFRNRGGRWSEHGCLHCRVLHAALCRLGLAKKE